MCDADMTADLQLGLAMTVPHIMYALIWCFPQAYRKVCMTCDPVNTFSTLAFALKAVQLLAFVSWAKANKNTMQLANVPVWVWPLALLMMAVGQLLNWATFRAIGTKGVFYGVRLGHKIKWYTGFPFNVVADPQYVGSILSFWAVQLVLHHATRSCFMPVLAVWTVLNYLASALIEKHN